MGTQVNGSSLITHQVASRQDTFRPLYAAATHSLFAGWKQGPRCLRFCNITIHPLHQSLRKEAMTLQAGGEPLDDLFTTILYSRDKMVLVL